MRSGTESLMCRLINDDYTLLPLLDAVIPAYLRARDVTAISDTTYTGASIEKAIELSSNDSFNDLRNCIAEYGLEATVGAFPTNNGRGVHTKYYIYNDRCGANELIKEINESARIAHESMRRGEPSEHYPRGLMLDGELLSYDECCSKLFSEEMMADTIIMSQFHLLGEDVTPSNFGPEKLVLKRIAKQMRDLLGDRHLDSENAITIAKTIPLNQLMCYFTKSFYPHAVGCTKAYEKGIRTYKVLMDEDERLAGIYKDLSIPFNLYVANKFSKHLSQGGNDFSQIEYNMMIAERLAEFSDHPELVNLVSRNITKTLQMLSDELQNRKNQIE